MTATQATQTRLERRRPAEQTRARLPDAEGHIERGGVRVRWERHGDGDPTLLLLPAWSLIHSRQWKAQVPYLARHFRVVTFDPRGNGRSDRPVTAEAYDDDQFVADAEAVLDATGTGRAVLVGLSRGAQPASRVEVEALLRRVRCPVLVVHGSDDRVRPHAVGAAVAELTGGRLVTIEGGGHCPQARHPVIVNLLVREFVETLGGGAAR
jgi:pimeloyl-ACP methyl ester carboxylesterase